MARLVHVNGPPGIGKTTLAALYADRNPGTLNLDVDSVHRLVGGWQGGTDTWPVVWSLVRAMAATHLDGGRDVVLPQYAGIEEVAGFERLAREHEADFSEVVLLDDRAASAERFDRRSRDSDDPWIRHHHQLMGQQGGAGMLGTMYDNLMEVVHQRPGAVVVTSVAGAVEETYKLMTEELIRVGQYRGVVTGPAAPADLAVPDPARRSDAERTT